MTRAEKAKPRGRMRALAQTKVLEFLAERQSATLHEVAAMLGATDAHAYTTLDRMQDQRLVVLTQPGRRGKNPSPSVWEIRESFERRQADHHQQEFDA